MGACSQIFIVAVLFQSFTSSQGGACSKIWENPCNQQLPVRHMRSAITNRQLNTISVIVDNYSVKALRTLYPKGPKISTGSSNCPKLQKMIRPIKHAKDIKSANQNFYISLIKFAIFLDKLQKVHIQTLHTFDQEARRNIFDNTCNNIKQTICEYKDSLYKEHKIPLEELERPVHVNTRCLPRAANLSDLQMLDIQFFKKLNKFFKASNRTMKKLQDPKSRLRKKNKNRNRNKNRKLTPSVEKNIDNLFDLNRSS